MSAPTSTAHRFDAISLAPPDAILGLSEAFAKDSRSDKMNLSVGVYKDADGITPVMRCVKQAEARLVETETTKGYLPIDGFPDYRDVVAQLVFGDEIDPQRTAVVQAPGGTGALRVAAEFLATQCAAPPVYLPLPTWANHNAIMAAAGLPVETLRYLADDKRTLDFAGLLDDLQNKPRRGDVVLLHACCHNPTGVDPTTEQWSQLADVIAERGLIPLLDFAYQGFGDGLEQDAAGLRTILSKVDEAIVCSSYSKNFGLYSERVGAVCLMASGHSARDAALSQLKRAVRANYSNPPRHGAAVVATILHDQELTSSWRTELEEMRVRITSLRHSFVQRMTDLGTGTDFSFLLDQKGMFSFSGLNSMQVDQLRHEHGIYIVGSGRINVAGMHEDRMDYLCEAVASVLQD